MANDADQIVVASNGTVYVAATSATAPTTATNSLTGFTELGFVTEEGVTFTDSKEITDINVWQQFYPARKIVTSKASSVSFQLREWRAHNVQLAFGGGTITGSGSNYTYVPPAAGTIDERSMVIDWQDGSKNYRLYIPRGIVSDAVETNLVRTNSAVLPITFSVTPASDTADPYKLFTNDPAFADYSL